MLANERPKIIAAFAPDKKVRDCALQLSLFNEKGLAALEQLSKVNFDAQSKPNPMPTLALQDKGLAAMERLDKSLDEF